MSKTSTHQKFSTGYKQTNLGTLPNTWEAVLLGDLFVFKNGLNKAKRFFGSGTPIVNYMDVFERPGLRPGDLSGRVSLTPEEIRNFKVQRGDVFFTRTSETVEEIGVASVMLYVPHDTVFSGFVLRARPRDGRLDDRYKQYCFTHRVVRSQIISNATYTTRALTNGRTLSTVWIAVPPAPEQRAIAEALSDVDGLLNALEALIAKKRAIKQAVMQQLLTGRTRLPGFSGAWEKTRMGQIGSIYGGLSGKSKIDFGGGNARYVTFLGVLENVILDVRHTERVHVGSGESQNSVMKGDLLFNASSETPGYLAIGAVMGKQLDNLYLNSFCFGFRIHDNDKYVPLYLAYFFRGSVGRNIMNALAQGATRYNVSKSQFRALELSIPSGDEQHAIASVLSDMDTEITALEQRRDKTRAIKQGMMQQLLMGRVRLVKSRIDTD
jgi:type I restriction enzyme S subunit